MLNLQTRCEHELCTGLGEAILYSAEGIPTVLCESHAEELLEVGLMFDEEATEAGLDYYAIEQEGAPWITD